MSKKIFKIFIYIVLAILILYFILKSTIVIDVLQVIFISFIIAYAMRPLQEKLVSKGMNKRVAAIIIILVLILILCLSITLLIPSLFKESVKADRALSKIGDIIDKIYAKFEKINKDKTLYVIVDTLNDKIKREGGKFLTKLIDSAINMGANIISLSVIPIIIYYFIVDKNYINNKLLMLFPVAIRGMIKKIAEDIDKILTRYITSQLILSLFMWIATFIALAYLKVDFPIILSLLNGIFNIIPYFGPILGGLPALFMAFIRSPETGIYTLIFLIIIQQIEGNLIAPKITSDFVSMHPITVIILLIVGGKIGGAIGMILAVPIGVIIKVVYEDLNYYLF